MRAVLVLATATAALLAVPSASGKTFEPGDVRVCNATRCAPIVKREVLPLLLGFYYARPVPRVVPRPAPAAPYYELRFDNGYVTGIVATRRLGRFLSYGVNLGRFQRGRWYRLPPRLSANLRLLTSDLPPLRLERAALAKSR
jgi:hypothetical protein